MQGQSAHCARPLRAMTSRSRPISFYLGSACLDAIRAQTDRNADPPILRAGYTHAVPAAAGLERLPATPSWC